MVVDLARDATRKLDFTTVLEAILKGRQKQSEDIWQRIAFIKFEEWGYVRKWLVVFLITIHSSMNFYTHLQVNRKQNTHRIKHLKRDWTLLHVSNFISNPFESLLCFSGIFRI